MPGTAMDEFLLRALLAGLAVAAAAGPLGAFVVWRRMAYFGDTLAHAALLGVALGFLLDANPLLGIVAVCLAVSLALAGLAERGALASDTLLGILSHGTLALGLVVVATMETLRVDLLAYLFGDILAVTWSDLAWTAGGSVLALAVLAAIWRPLLAITVHEDLARVEGVAVGPVRLAYMLLMAVVIAAAMKVVGIILVTSLLIIPAAAARPLARSPEAMAAAASALGGLAVAGGLAGSLAWDMPAGPAIVVAALALFLLAQIATVALRRSPA